MYRHFRFVNKLFCVLVAVSILLTSVPAPVGAAGRAGRPSPAEEPPATTLPVQEVATGVLSSLGGKLISLDGRVRVQAPIGALARSRVITLKTQEISTPPGRMGAALRFSLEPDLQFSEPVTLDVKLQGLVSLKDLPKGWWPYVAYLKDPSRNEREYIPLKSVDWETGVITAQLDHFSEYEVGVTSENGWRLSYNDAVVNGFRGNLSYQVPLEMPPGQGGLQPDLTLTYNSDRVNGILSEVQSDWVGLGWSLDVPQIARTVERCPWSEDALCVSTSHNTLIMNGTGYALVPDPKTNPNEDPNHGVGRYHTEKETFFHIEKRGGAVNALGYYWVVVTRDGTEYQFGYTPDAEQVLCGVAYLGSAVYRWRLNQIQDTLGNTIVFTYAEENSGNCGAADHERASYLSEIAYNKKPDGTWATRIVFNLRSRESDPDGHDQEDYLFFQQQYLDSIRVLQDEQLTQEYRLGYDFHERSRRLQSVTTVGKDGESALPATTFEYGIFNNSEPDWADGQEYPYSRLVAVNNGYGGRTEIDYAQAVGKDKFFYHYRARERRILDGIGHTSRVMYEYGPECMDETDSKCDDGYRSWTLKGYEWSKQELQDYDGNLLKTVTDRYVLSWPLTGRVGVHEVSDAPGATKQRTGTEWGYTWLVPSSVDFTTGVALYYSTAVTETVTSGGESVSTRVAFTHDDYGNVKAEYNYGAEELLVNPGFENDMEGWELFYDESSPASATTDVSFAGHGSLMLKGDIEGGAYQDIAGLVPGETYVVRAWVRAEPGGTSQFRLWLTNGASEPFVPTEEWSEERLSFVADASGQVRIALHYMPEDGAIFVDEVALAREQDVGDERSIHRFFFNLTNNGRWLIGLKQGENLFSGITPNMGGPSPETQTIWYYDDDTYDHTRWDESDQIEHGLLTMMGQGLYDPSGRSFSTTTYEYDMEWSTLVAVTDPNGNTTTTEYDGTFHLYPTNVCRAAGTDVQRCSQIEYYGVEGVDADYGLPGQVKRVVDPNLAATEYRYDNFGRLTRVWRPGEDLDSPPNRLIGYSDGAHPDWRPLVISIFDKTDPDVSWSDFWTGAGGVWTRELFDGLGRSVQTQRSGSDWTPGGGANEHDVVQDTVYDALGRVREQSVPYEVSRFVYDAGNPQNPYHTPDLTQLRSSTEYDALGRVERVVNTDGTTTTSAYVGRTTIVTDANGHRRDSVTDAYGRLVAVHEYAGGPDDPFTTLYAYDLLGNLIQVTDAAGNITAMSYDALGRKTWMDDPDMGEWVYEYDPAGNVITQTDALSQALLFTYDELNRLVRRQEAGGEVLAEYTYDASDPDAGQYGIGRRTGMTDPSGATDWTYDERGRLTAESKTIHGDGTFTTTYTYDALDRVVAMTYPDGETVVHSYDVQGLPESLSRADGAFTYVENVDYNVMGQPTLIEFGDGNLDLQTSYGYRDDNFRLESIVTTGPSELLQNLTYTYDAVGNVATITDVINAGQVQNFSYDGLDRLEHAWTTPVGDGTFNETYAYDAIGNITAKGVMDYAYDPDRPHAVQTLASGPTQVGSFVYDANGNMTSRNENGATYLQSFNVENRLESVTHGGETTTFVYDGDGNRVKKVESHGETTIHVGVHYEVSYPTRPAKLVTGVLTNVTSDWQTVVLPQTYDSMVVVAAPSYDGSDLPAVVRVHNASGNSFQIRVQNPSNEPLSGYTVHYLVVEEGVYTEELHGIKMEAVKYTSTVTDGAGSWEGESRSYQQSYTSPVVLGQVMTANDGNWSVFWTRGSWQGNPPTAAHLYTGKHVGEDLLTTRADEIIGYIVIEAGSGSVGGGAYVAALGPDSVAGIDNGPPFTYAIDGPAGSEVAIVSATAMDGGDGGWPVLYGSDPLSPSQLHLAFDEDQTWDDERRHLDEEVPYVVFADLSPLSSQDVEVTKYYSIGNRRVAMRVDDGGSDDVFFLHGDHLGSTSLVTTGSDVYAETFVVDAGSEWSRQLYKPYGETRATEGASPTDLQFTGQRNESDLGLYDYGARFYDPFAARFISPDTIVPDSGNPQTFNRYAYVLGNPLKYTDPTGHGAYISGDGLSCPDDAYDPACMDDLEKYEFAEMAGIDVRTLYPWNPYRNYADRRYVDNRPKLTGIGFYAGKTAGVNVGVGAFVTEQTTVAYMFDSEEVVVAESSGAGVDLSTPKGAHCEVFFGLVLIFDKSGGDLSGRDVEVGVGTGADVGATGSLEVSVSRDMEEQVMPDGSTRLVPAIDEKYGRTPTAVQVGPSFGLASAPNGGDVGLSVSQSVSNVTFRGSWREYLEWSR